MRRMTLLVAFATVLGVVLTGCASTAQPHPVAQTRDPQVVTTAGLVGIGFGDTRAELERQHGLHQRAGDCAARLPGYPSASPVFDDDRLVLLWIDPPLRTADGFTVGTPVDDVRERYPRAERLTAPEGTYRFDGLLVTSGDRAYLFLHDRHEVRKVIVGYTDHADRLFHHGFGTC